MRLFTVSWGGEDDSWSEPEPHKHCIYTRAGVYTQIQAIQVTRFIHSYLRHGNKNRGSSCQCTSSSSVNGVCSLLGIVSCQDSKKELLEREPYRLVCCLLQDRREWAPIHSHRTFRFKYFHLCLNVRKQGETCGRCDTFGAQGLSILPQSQRLPEHLQIHDNSSFLWPGHVQLAT